MKVFISALEDRMLFDVDDLVVVRTDTTTLVLPRERAGDIKALLAKLDGAQT